MNEVPEERRDAVLTLRLFLLEFARLMGRKTRTKDSYRRMNQVMGAAYFATGIVGLKGEPFREFLHEILDEFMNAVHESERVAVFGTLRSIVLTEIVEEEIELGDWEEKGEQA